MKILGYSERGIINSLLFNIGGDKELMDEFIGLIKIPEIEKLKDSAKDYTVLLEQSFSRFGDADLVVIIHYEKPEDNKVLFIEGKVKTSNSSWNIQSQFKKYIEFKGDEKKIKPKNYWSNLFSQLYLKKLLIENWDKVKNIESFVVKSDYVGERKIGTNKVVLAALEIIRCDKKNAYFVGLIPTRQKEFDKFHNKVDFEMSFLLWETVHDFCRKKEKLKDVLEIFKYNDRQIY